MFQNLILIRAIFYYHNQDISCWISKIVITNSNFRINGYFCILLYVVLFLYSSIKFNEQFEKDDSILQSFIESDNY